MKQGKRIMQASSDPPVDVYDHLADSSSKREYYQLYHQDKVLHLVQVAPCAAEVKGFSWTLDMFEKLVQYPYLNFAVYEDS